MYSEAVLPVHLGESSETIRGRLSCRGWSVKPSPAESNQPDVTQVRCEGFHSELIRRDPDIPEVLDLEFKKDRLTAAEWNKKGPWDQDSLIQTALGIRARLRAELGEPYYWNAPLENAEAVDYLLRGEFHHRWRVKGGARFLFFVGTGESEDLDHGYRMEMKVEALSKL